MRAPEQAAGQEPAGDHLPRKRRTKKQKRKKQAGAAKKQQVASVGAQMFLQRAAEDLARRQRDGARYSICYKMIRPAVNQGRQHAMVCAGHLPSHNPPSPLQRSSRRRSAAPSSRRSGSRRRRPAAAGHCAPAAASQVAAFPPAVVATSTGSRATTTMPHGAPPRPGRAPPPPRPPSLPWYSSRGARSCCTHRRSATRPERRAPSRPVSDGRVMGVTGARGGHPAHAGGLLPPRRLVWLGWVRGLLPGW